MTVAQLKEQMDRHFDAQQHRMDAGFNSIHDKLNAILRTLDGKYRHHDEVLDLYERRLNDLEARRRQSRTTERQRS